MHILELNHVALHIRDVDQSVRFYRDVLLLPPLPRPAFDFPGAWFRLGIRQELHLIGDRSQQVHSSRRGTHFALQIESTAPWHIHLESLGVTFDPPKLRPDGAVQIFVSDPDGHWIELVDLSGIVAAIPESSSR